MMKKSLLLAMLMAIITIAPVKADEGMWLPMLIKRLNQRDLQKMGMQLTPEEIYSVNNSSMKDAIVSMGGFCTAEMVSPNGLMLTNHHCGYDQIRENSTVEDDILTNGFWAKDYSEEKPNDGLFVSFLVRMKDVTEQILPQLDGIEDEAARSTKIAELSKKIADKAEEGTHYNANVKSFYVGKEFYLFVYEIYRDVRLVGTPPSSIGKYGGDTDNWMWPRQTGDFAVFRVYSGPDGKPAEYSEENIPMVPKHFLPISIAGMEEGDFAMTFGYPGSTDRYLTSFGVEQGISKKNPAIVEIRDAKIKVLRADMNKSDKVRLMYAAKIAQIANYWKYFIGQTEQLKGLDVIGTKEELEAEFQQWADSDPARKAKYGGALNMIKDGYAQTDRTAVGGTYVVEGGLLGADAVLFTYRMSNQLTAYIALEGIERDEMKDNLKIAAAEFFEGANMPTDQKLFAVTQDLYSKNIPTDQQPEYMRKLGSKYAGKWDKFADKVYSKSVFTDLNRLTSFIENPKEKTLEKDPMKEVADDMFAIYRGQAQENAEGKDMITKGNRLFQEGLREMFPDKDFYPDANSTMRASFGTVESYNPKDGVKYEYYTTLAGVMAKENPDDDEFIVPAKLKQLYEAEDYGQYADKDGTLHVNFLSTNDITGGNSGSPVINGAGELIGIAFDGNWEAMSGDINFETSVQRTISVDIRYVLFVIDKMGGATHLIDEMTLVKTRSIKDKKSEPASKKIKEARGEKLAPSMN